MLKRLPLLCCCLALACAGKLPLVTTPAVKLAADVPSPEKVWQYDGIDDLLNVGLDGTVYVEGANGELIALDRDGHQKWSVPLKKLEGLNFAPNGNLRVWQYLGDGRYETVELTPEGKDVRRAESWYLYVTPDGFSFRTDLTETAEGKFEPAVVIHAPDFSVAHRIELTPKGVPEHSFYDLTVAKDGKAHLLFYRTSPSAQVVDATVHSDGRFEERVILEGVPQPGHVAMGPREYLVFTEDHDVAPCGHIMGTLPVSAESLAIVDAASGKVRFNARLGCPPPSTEDWPRAPRTDGTSGYDWYHRIALFEDGGFVVATARAVQSFDHDGKPRWSVELPPKDANELGNDEVERLLADDQHLYIDTGTNVYVLNHAGALESRVRRRYGGTSMFDRAGRMYAPVEHNGVRAVAAFQVGRGARSPAFTTLGWSPAGPGTLGAMDPVASARRYSTATPRLEVKLAFDDGADRTLDAEEPAKLTVLVRNTGKGSASGLATEFAAEGADVRADTTGAEASALAPGAATSFSVKLLPSELLADGEARLCITVREADGYDTDKTCLKVPTRAAAAPSLVVEAIDIDDDDVGLSQGNGDHTLQLGETAEISVVLRNKGKGKARAVGFEATTNSNEVSLPGASEQSLGDLEPGERKKASFVVVTTKRLQGDQLPVTFRLTEARKRFSRSEPISLKLGQRATAVVQADRPNLSNTVSETPVAFEDVDAAPRTDAQEDPDAVAIVVGVEKYGMGIAPVPFAGRDAESFALYARKVLGVPFANVRVLVDDNATHARLMANLTEWLRLKARAKGKARIYFFFSGHGTPAQDETTGRTYARLVPFDGDPSLTSTLIDVDEVYAAISAVQPKEAFVFLDTCFSGRGEKSVIASGTRPVLAVKAREPQAPTIVAFAAADANQLSTTLAGAKHGTFTYELLRGLGGRADADRDGKLTVGELADFLSREVPKVASDQNLDQTPRLMPDVPTVRARVLR